MSKILSVILLIIMLVAVGWVVLTPAFSVAQVFNPTLAEDPRLWLGTEWLESVEKVEYLQSFTGLDFELTQNSGRKITDLSEEQVAELDYEITIYDSAQRSGESFTIRKEMISADTQILISSEDGLNDGTMYDVLVLTEFADSINANPFTMNVLATEEEPTTVKILLVDYR